MKNKNTNRSLIWWLALMLIAVFIFGGIYILRNTFERSKVQSLTKNLTSTLVEKPDNITTLIVPHHDLVAKKRTALFVKARENANPKTVILVSPNHFNTGNGGIITGDKEWNLSDGKILPDKDKIAKLVDSAVLINDNSAFANEHGITNILPDIKASFPDSKIIPIIVKQNVDSKAIGTLYEKLSTICTTDCMVIASVDCSHYNPGALAELHDSMTIRALTNMDEDLAWKSEVDSNQSLDLAIKWAKGQNANTFHLEESTNSGKMSNDRDAESTSYIFGWYQKGDPLPKINDEISFMIGGDMMYDRNINYTFPGMKLYDAWSDFGQRIFWGTDLAMANLEGPISPTDRPPIKTHSMNFNFPPKTTDILSWLHINAVSLANNHTLNNGRAGLDNTEKVLTNAGIAWIGEQASYNTNSVKRFTAGEEKVSVITIESLEITTDITSDIKQEVASGSHVIVVPHWGTEYEPIHNSSQAKLAHAWIDAGADMVVGGHPHVVEDAEMYKGKPIFYSLGNLLFDQDFLTKTQRGLIVAGKFKDNKLTIVLLPTRSEKYKPRLLVGDEKTALINNFRKDLGQPECSSSYGCDKIMINLGGN